MERSDDYFWMEAGVLFKNALRELIQATIPNFWLMSTHILIPNVWNVHTAETIFKVLAHPQQAITSSTGNPEQFQFTGRLSGIRDQLVHRLRIRAAEKAPT